MNYIQEINAFYDWLETNTISDSSIGLWHALMHINNKSGWKTEFAVAISTLETKTGLKKGAIIRARHRLQQAGRIRFRSRDGQLSAVYEIIPFEFQNETQPESLETDCVPKKDTNWNTNRTQSGTLTETQTETQSGTINKLNNTKLNNTSLPISPVGEAEVSASKIIDLYNEICKNLPPAKILTEKRRKAINARLREHGYENVVKMLQKASKSNFLAGQSQRGFIADFDWLFKPENFAKTLEGKYDDDRYKPASQGTVTNGKDSNVAYLEGAYERLTQQP